MTALCNLKYFFQILWPSHNIWTLKFHVDDQVSNAVGLRNYFNVFIFLFFKILFGSNSKLVLNLSLSILNDVSHHLKSYNYHSWAKFKVVLVRKPKDKLYSFHSKNLSKHNFWEYVVEFPSNFWIFVRNVTTVKNWIQKIEGNSTTPKNCALTEFLHERSTIFLLVFSLKVGRT